MEAGMEWQERDHACTRAAEPSAGRSGRFCTIQPSLVACHSLVCLGVLGEPGGAPSGLVAAPRRLVGRMKCVPGALAPSHDWSLVMCLVDSDKGFEPRGELGHPLLECRSLTREVHIARGDGSKAGVSATGPNGANQGSAREGASWKARLHVVDRRNWDIVVLRRRAVLEPLAKD